MLVPSKVVSCISNPNYQRNSFRIETWMMQQIRLLLTPFQRETRTLHQSWYTCIKFVILIHDDESIMNPSWIPGQCLSLHFFDVGLWEARLMPCQSMSAVVPGCEDCEALRKQTRWQRPLSIADSMKQKQVGGLNGFRTELNWTDEWIDGLMLTLMDVFFSHRIIPQKKKQFDFNLSLKRWHRRNPGS